MMMMMMMMNDVLEMFHAPAARGLTVEDRKLLQQQLTHIHTNQTQRPLAWGAICLLVKVMQSDEKGEKHRDRNREL